MLILRDFLRMKFFLNILHKNSLLKDVGIGFKNIFRFKKKKNCGHTRQSKLEDFF